MFSGTTYSSYFNYAGVEDTYIRGGISGSRVVINDIPNGDVSVGAGTGKLGINVQFPVAPLEVRQVVISNVERGIMLRNTQNNTWELYNGLPLYFRYNGTIRASIDWSNGNYSSVSDQRLKKDIQPLPGVLQKLLSLPVFRYRFVHDDSSDKQSIGFLAQDVKTLFPDLVTSVDGTQAGYNGIHDLHLLNYTGLSVLSIKAIQEQQKIIESQANEIDKLKLRLEKLEKQLSTSLQ